MIKVLDIKNFKSVKHIRMQCKKVNIFIGEPNSGKSNIIEALALQSQNIVGNELNKQILRYKTISDLFFDSEITNPIEVSTGDKLTKLEYSVRADGLPENEFALYLDVVASPMNSLKIAHNGTVSSGNIQGTTRVHYYEYKRLSGFMVLFQPFLAVPYGENLPGLLQANADFKKWVSELLQSKGMRLNLKPIENDIAFSKIINDEIYSYPYYTLSETLQRIIFYTIAIKSNKESILLFDEPETNTFPFYTKFLAERIALDETNQFFITTHNPYMLLSLIEKTKIENLGICIVQMKNYQTVIHVLKESQISQVLDFDSEVFFNFDKLLS